MSDSTRKRSKRSKKGKKSTGGAHIYSTNTYSGDESTDTRFDEFYEGNGDNNKVREHPDSGKSRLTIFRLVCFVVVICGLIYFLAEVSIERKPPDIKPVTKNAINYERSDESDDNVKQLYKSNKRTFTKYSPKDNIKRNSKRVKEKIPIRHQDEENIVDSTDSNNWLYYVELLTSSMNIYDIISNNGDNSESKTDIEYSAGDSTESEEEDDVNFLNHNGRIDAKYENFITWFNFKWWFSFHDEDDEESTDDSCVENDGIKNEDRSNEVGDNDDNSKEGNGYHNNYCAEMENNDNNDDRDNGSNEYTNSSEDIDDDDDIDSDTCDSGNINDDIDISDDEDNIDNNDDNDDNIDSNDDNDDNIDSNDEHNSDNKDKSPSKYIHRKSLLNADRLAKSAIKIKKHSDSIENDDTHDGNQDNSLLNSKEYSNIAYIKRKYSRNNLDFLNRWKASFENKIQLKKLSINSNFSSIKSRDRGDLQPSVERDNKFHTGSYEENGKSNSNSDKYRKSVDNSMNTDCVEEEMNKNTDMNKHYRIKTPRDKRRTVRLTLDNTCLDNCDQKSDEDYNAEDKLFLIYMDDTNSDTQKDENDRIDDENDCVDENVTTDGNDDADDENDSTHHKNYSIDDENNCDDENVITDGNDDADDENDSTNHKNDSVDDENDCDDENDGVDEGNYIIGDDDMHDEYDNENYSEDEKEDDTSSDKTDQKNSENSEESEENFKDEILRTKQNDENNKVEYKPTNDVIINIIVGAALFIVGYAVLFRKWNNYVEENGKSAKEEMYSEQDTQCDSCQSTDQSQLLDSDESIAGSDLDDDYIPSDEDNLLPPPSAERYTTPRPLSMHDYTLDDYLQQPSDNEDTNDDDDIDDENDNEINSPHLSTQVPNLVTRNVEQSDSGTDDTDTGSEDEGSDDMLPNEFSQMYSKASITNDEDLLMKDELDEADDFLDNDQINEALKIYTNVLNVNSKSPRAKYGIARCLDAKAERLRNNNMLIHVIEGYKDALDMENIPDELFKKIADRVINRMRFRGDYTSAILIHGKVIGKFPDNPVFQNDMAVTYLMLNKNEEAEKVLRRVLSGWPDNGFAKAHYGFILKLRNQYMEAVELLTDGIKSREPGTQDSRFYFHLGDALHRLGRISEALEIYEYGVQHGMFRSKYQRSLYNVDRLVARPWWTLEETTYESFFRTLEQNWRNIRDEALSVIQNKRDDFLQESESLREIGDWSQFELYSRGIQKPQCKNVPLTCKLVSSFSPAAECQRGQIKFSLMSPNTHVWPHCGPTNCRLRAHLGLIVPSNVTIRVANETRNWQEGKVLVFDDSFEHEVWHNGSTDRLVLIVDVWHPELNESERKKLFPI